MCSPRRLLPISVSLGAVALKAELHVRVDPHQVGFFDQVEHGGAISHRYGAIELRAP